MAYAISKLDGKAGLASWRWVFVIGACILTFPLVVHLIDFVILEGLMTVGCATAVFFLISDFPEETKWLSDDEKAFVKARLAEDIGDSQVEVHPTWRGVLDVLKDFKLILGGLASFGLVVPGYGYAYFAPAIIRSLGYSPVMTQLYSVPPWVASFALSMAVAAASDYYKRKYIFILPLLLISVVGITVLLTVHDSVNVRYGALFLSVMGGFSAVPIVICWFSTNRESMSCRFLKFLFLRLTFPFNSWWTLEAQRRHRFPDRLRQLRRAYRYLQFLGE